MANGDSKALARRTASDKVLRDKKAFNIAEKSKYDEYEHAIASVVYGFFFIKSLQVGLLDDYGQRLLGTRNKSGIENEIVSNKELRG